MRMRSCISSVLISLYVQMTLTTGMLILGKMSVGMRSTAPKPNRHTRMIIAATECGWDSENRGSDIRYVFLGNHARCVELRELIPGAGGSRLGTQSASLRLVDFRRSPVHYRDVMFHR